jgi:hypothetical protein
MIVDSSEFVAMALREAGHDLLIDKLSAGIGAPTLVAGAIPASARDREQSFGADVDQVASSRRLPSL